MRIEGAWVFNAPSVCPIIGNQCQKQGQCPAMLCHSHAGPVQPFHHLTGSAHVPGCNPLLSSAIQAVLHNNIMYAGIGY